MSKTSAAGEPKFWNDQWDNQYRITNRPYVITESPRSYGWICPKCSRVWGPSVDQCAKCNDLVITINVGAKP